MNRDQGGHFELLKLRMARAGGEGCWTISSILPLKLRSRSGSLDFYEVEDDVILETAFTISSTSFILGQSIVPVVARVAGEERLRCLGTGFFVSCTGILITAAHVISAPLEQRYGKAECKSDGGFDFGEVALGVMIPVVSAEFGRGFLFRQLEWASFLSEDDGRPSIIRGPSLRLAYDVAICKVPMVAADTPYQPLLIVQPGLEGVGMAVGKNATAIGFGAMSDINFSADSGRKGSALFPFDLHVSQGVILENFPNNAALKSVRTPGACFSASLKIPPGMSGSPIFDSEGIYVHGVVSSGWEDESGLASLGYGSMLAAAFSWPVGPLGGKTLQELHRSPTQGFPKLRGPGL